MVRLGSGDVLVGHAGVRALLNAQATVRSILSDEPAAVGGPRSVDRAAELASALELARVAWFSYRYASGRETLWCAHCGLGSLDARSCLGCGRHPDEPEPEAEGGGGEAFLALRTRLVRMLAAEVLALADAGATPDDLVERLLAELLERTTPPTGAWLAEWLLEQPEIDDVFGDDETVESYLRG